MQSSNEMTWLEHFTELRKRIIYILIVSVIILVIGLVFAKPMIVWLKSAEPAAGIEWNVFSPWDSIRIYMQVAFVFSLIITLPFALYQIWAFAKPGLKETEQKAILMYIPFAFLLYVCGISFAYFVVFPFAFRFTSMLTGHLGLTETYGIMQYFMFMFNIVLPIGILFELPVIVMFLTRLRILNPSRLVKMRKHAYLALVILSTLFTPPDFISPILVSIPLIIIYEISVHISKFVYRKHVQIDEALVE